MSSALHSPLGAQRHGDGASHPPAKSRSSSSSSSPPCPDLLLGGEQQSREHGQRFSPLEPQHAVTPSWPRHLELSHRDTVFSTPAVQTASFAGCPSLPLPLPFPPPSAPLLPLLSSPSNAVFLGGPQSRRAFPCRGRWSPPAWTPRRSRSSGKGSPSTSASWWPPSSPCSASPSRCSKVSREPDRGGQGGQTLLPPPASSCLLSPPLFQRHAPGRQSAMAGRTLRHLPFTVGSDASGCPSTPDPA